MNHKVATQHHLSTLTQKKVIPVLKLKVSEQSSTTIQIRTITLEIFQPLKFTAHRIFNLIVLTLTRNTEQK